MTGTRIPSLIVYASVLLSLWHCKDAEVSRETTGARQPVSNEMRTQGPAVLASTASDTVYLIAGKEEFKDTVLWVSHRAVAAEHLAIPQPATSAELLDLDRDGVPDLVLRFVWEEFNNASVRLGGPLHARTVFTDHGHMCSAPELVDVTGDGLVDIIEYDAAATSEDLCAYLAPRERPCLPTLVTEWATVWVQKPGGTFVDDSVAAAAYYEARGRAYAEGLAQFRARDSKQDRVVNRSFCEAVHADAIEKMVRRAFDIGQLAKRGRSGQN